jgi:hypothetical protein
MEEGPKILYRVHECNSAMTYFYKIYFIYFWQEPYHIPGSRYGWIQRISPAQQRSPGTKCAERSENVYISIYTYDT